MKKEKDSINLFTSTAVCVIIPTYNNEKTVAKVISDVQQYTTDIIVVNDGSTDSTPSILNEFTEIQQLHHKINKGKGWALRNAFDHAMKNGYRYAITIDSDGQHFAKDLPIFLNKLKECQNAVIIGARNMNQEFIPGKSSFGCKFSNFWFKVETGIDCPDTQSGYRLYPLDAIKGMKFFTRKYEFEIEVLVRLAWKGVKVEAVPVNIYYAPPKIRVTHFRPKIDFTRISILNTILVLIAFIYIKPKKQIIRFFKPNDFRKKFKEQLIKSDQSHLKKSVSIGAGVCVGILPIWGFQLMIIILLSMLLKLNKAMAIIASNISVPPMIPLIVFSSYKMGAFFIPPQKQVLQFSNNINLDSIKSNFAQYLYGSIFLAIISGLSIGILTYTVLKLNHYKKTKQQAV